MGLNSSSHFSRGPIFRAGNLSLRQVPVSPHSEFAPTSIQLDQVRPQLDRVIYRDYSSLFYPLCYKITDGEKLRKVRDELEIGSYSGGETCQGAKPVSFFAYGNASEAG